MTEDMMQKITYRDLVARYGTAAAFDLLLQVEKVAKINSEIISMEEDERFQAALEALNTIDFASYI